MGVAYFWSLPEKENGSLKKWAWYPAYSLSVLRFCVVVVMPTYYISGLSPAVKRQFDPSYRYLPHNSSLSLVSLVSVLLGYPPSPPPAPYWLLLFCFYFDFNLLHTI